MKSQLSDSSPTIPSTGKGRPVRAGDVCFWLDQGPVILLVRTEIEDPIPMDELAEYDQIPRERGWTVKLLHTGEILDVHDDTLFVWPSRPFDECM